MKDFAPTPREHYIQVRSHSLVSYSVPIERPNYHRHEVQQHPTYSGQITAHAQKRIRRACEILLMRSPERHVWNTVTNQPLRFRLTFATLTISQLAPVPHDEAYQRGLKPLLRILRNKWGWTDYIWKAELQQRGQIHYHVTGNQFLDWRVLKSTWNNIQYSAGWLNCFHARHGHYTPNSTDIHAVGKIHRLDLYLAKYIAKNGGKIAGKCWDTSASLAGKKFFAFPETWDVADQIGLEITSGAAKLKALEQCSIIETPTPQKFIPAHERPNFAAWLK